MLGGSMSENTDLKQTLFFNKHVQAMAKMVDFGGWNMPIQYSGLAGEHKTCRSSVGLFDVSHMGEIWIEGPNALEAVRYVVTSSVDLIDGQAQYTCLCHEDGGIVDDIIVYQFSKELILFCVNASNREKDFAHLQKVLQNFEGATVRNASDDYAQVAIQGRYAEATLQKLTTYPLAEIKYYHFAQAMVDGIDNCIIARTGYTGEDGFEVFLPLEENASTQTVANVWDHILEAGAEFGIVPVGLGARDTLRLEARMNLYGQEMTDQTNPLEAGVAWTIDWAKPNFVGRQAILDHKNSDEWTMRLVGLLVDKKIPRSHYSVMNGDEIIGEITSGTKSPSTGESIALARVHRNFAKIGTEVEVDIRGKKAKAKVVKGAFYKRDY